LESSNNLVSGVISTPTELLDVLLFVTDVPALAFFRDLSYDLLKMTPVLFLFLLNLTA